MVPSDTMWRFPSSAAFLSATHFRHPLVELPLPRFLGGLPPYSSCEELAHERGLCPTAFGRSDGRRRDGSRYAALLLGFAQLVLERRDLRAAFALCASSAAEPASRESSIPAELFDLPP